MELNNCTITGCKMPIYADVNIANHISGGSFTGNITDAIRVRGDAGDRQINTSQTWTDLGVPYRVASTSGFIQIRGGAVLTIEAGVVVEFEDGQGITVDGNNSDGSALVAIGTSTNPVIFTGVTKMPGAWRSIYYGFSSSVRNNLSYVLIEYAGDTNSNGAIEMWSADPLVNITNSTFKDINGCGIYDYNVPGVPNPNLTQNNNTIENVNGGLMCIG